MFTPFLTTGIGTLPHKDAKEACRLVLDTFDIPFWPQLPNLSFLESMIFQFSEGIPSIRIDDQRERVWVEKGRSDDLTDFYKTYSEDWRASVSEGNAKGLYTFSELIKNRKL